MGILEKERGHGKEEEQVSRWEYRKRKEEGKARKRKR